MSEQFPYEPTIRNKLAAVLSGQIDGYEIVSNTSSNQYPQYTFRELSAAVEDTDDAVYYKLSREEAQQRLINGEYDPYS